MWNPLQWLAQGCLHVLSTKTFLALPKFPTAYPGTSWELAVTVGELRGGGSGVGVSLKNLPKVFLEAIHGCSQIFPFNLFSWNRTGRSAHPSLPISREGRWMHGRSATFFSQGSLKNLSCICFPSNIFHSSVIPFNRTRVLIYTVDGD